MQPNKILWLMLLGIIVRTGTRLYAISGNAGRVENAASGEATP